MQKKGVLTERISFIIIILSNQRREKYKKDVYKDPIFFIRLLFEILKRKNTQKKVGDDVLFTFDFFENQFLFYFRGTCSLLLLINCCE